MLTLKRSTDEVIFVLALLFFCVSTYLLLDESAIFKFGQRRFSDLEKVGVLTKKSNEVRRRISANIAWFPVDKKDALFLGDSIYTGSNSEAEINFLEGSDLSLSEETLITLEKSTEQTILNLKWGGLSGHIQKGKPLTLKVGNKLQTIKSNGAEIQINRSKKGELELSVQKGKVEITGLKKMAQVIKAGEALKAEEGKTKIIQYKIDLLTPVKDAVVFKEKGFTLGFKWEPKTPSANFTLVVAKDRNFKKIIYMKEAAKTDYIATDFPIAGLVYWKVIDRANKLTSATQSFSLFSAEPPMPIAPLNKALVFNSSTRKPATDSASEYPVSLQWAYRGKFNDFEVQVAKDSAFKQVVKSSDIKGWQKELDLAEGHYFWRVRVKNEALPNASWSKTGKMTVLRNLPAPKLKDRVKEMKVDKGQAFHNLNFFLRFVWKLLVTPALAEEKGMDLNWEKVVDATAYEITISTESNMSKIIFRERVNNNSFTWMEKQPGIYYWQVRAINGIGDLQPPSEIGKILLRVSSPKLESEIQEINPELKATDEPVEAYLEWKPIDKINNYLVEVSEGRGFNSVKEYVVKNKTSLKVMSLKTLYWRVSALDNKEQVIGDKTQTAEVQFNFKAPKILWVLPRVISGRYTVPTRFEPEKNGVKITEAQIDYELAGNVLTFGQRQFAPSKMKMVLGRSENSKYQLKFVVPAELVGPGLVEIESQKKNIFTKEVDPKKDQPKFEETGFFSLEGPELSDDQVREYSKLDQLHFCLRQRQGLARLSICSGNFVFEFIQGEWTSRLQPNEKPLKVQIANQDVPLKGVLNSTDAKNEFVAEFSDFSSVEIQAVAPHMEFDEVLKDDVHTYSITGLGDMPVNGVPLRGLSTPFKTWMLKMPVKKSSIQVVNDGGFAWHIDFGFDQLPPYESDHPLLEHGTKISTYKSKVDLRARVPSGFQVSSKTSTVTQNESLFDWEFPMGKKGQLTENSVTMTDTESKKEYQASYRIFRGYPMEVVSRLMALKGESGPIWALNELSLSYWFESFLGLKNYYFSQQRWGITAENLTNLTAGFVRVSSANLKYRFTPGVWNHDSTFGMMLGYQSLNYKGVLGSFAGAGAFLSLPSSGWVDKTLNIIPMLRHHKLLDFQAMYYPMLLGTSGRLTGNFNFKANGKVFLKPDFFVEIGLGIQQFGLFVNSTQYVDSDLIYWSGGLGWSL